jgi:hypothetical protein
MNQNFYFRSNKEVKMKQMRYLTVVILIGIWFAGPCPGISQEIFSPQVPFNFLYAGGVEHTFIRIEHSQWDAVEFQTTSTGRVQLLISLLNGNQIHYLDEEPLVQIRKKFDTSSKARDYRNAHIEYRSKIEKDGNVQVIASAKTDQGKIDVSFFSSQPLKEINQVVDPLNHAMETIAILHMERTALGDERTTVLLDERPLKIRKSDVSFVRGANFGIIFRTDKRDEKLVEFKSGHAGWVGARWVYDVGGNRVTYSIEKERDSEGYYEVKRLGNMIVQKGWMRPVQGGREVRRISTYSLVHDDKEFVVEFDVPLFFPAMLLENQILRSELGFKAKISNSGWAVTGRVKMVSWKEDHRIHTEMEFLPSFPEFLAKRPIYYEVIESKDHYGVIAKERK